MASATVTDKDPQQGTSHFSRALHQEKHERIARNALHDLFFFHDLLEKEMGRLRLRGESLPPVEAELLQHMQAVNEDYLAVICEFRGQGMERQQNALVQLSDSLLDLMKLVHKHKGH